jgi:hypothetical protein
MRPSARRSLPAFPQPDVLQPLGHLQLLGQILAASESDDVPPQAGCRPARRPLSCASFPQRP